MTIYSPNMLKTFKSCPKKYYFKYIQQISLPQKTSLFEKGKKVHALANYYLRGDNISKMEKALTPSETEIWEKLKNNKFFQMDYVNSEYNLSCKIGDFWIGGRLDAVVCHQKTGEPEGRKASEYQMQRGMETKMQRPVNNDSTTRPFNNSTDMDLAALNYYILDYKTGSIPKNPEYDYQTMVYLLCLYRKTIGNSEDNINLMPEASLKNFNMDSSNPKYCRNDNNFKYAVKFVYIDLKNNENHVIDFTPQRFAKYEKAVTKICREIENTRFPNEIEHSKMCEFCEYRKICN